MTMKTIPWDASLFLDSEEAQTEYINAALESGDTAFVLSAIGDVVKARGMSKIAQESGVSRQYLYRALCEDGNPSFDTLSKVLNALGGHLTYQAAQASVPPRARNAR